MTKVSENDFSDSNNTFVNETDNHSVNIPILLPFVFCAEFNFEGNATIAEVILFLPPNHIQTSYAITAAIHESFKVVRQMESAQIKKYS